MENGVLARKLRGPKMRLAGFPSMDPLCHTFASIAATRTRAELRPGIDVTVFGYEVLRHGDYLRGLRAPSAIYLLSYAARNGAGLIKAHPRLLGKVLDIYLGGDGSFEESNFARSLTAIDLAIYGRFVDLIARCFDEAIIELCGRSAIGQAKRARFEQIPGMVRIAPDNSEIFVIKLNYHVGDDKRGAGLDFVVPVSTLEPLKRDLTQAQTASDSNRGVWAEHMLSQVLSTQIPLTGTIPVGRMTVGELSALRAGDLIALPPHGLDRVHLIARGENRPILVTTGRLGLHDESKAIRLHDAPDPSFIAPLQATIENASSPEGGIDFPNLATGLAPAAGAATPAAETGKPPS
ncbi:MAG: flagellar motor switch protein FliM [Pseudomonadota bacterium]